jgi:RND family efflux transporter MFP subunit
MKTPRILAAVGIVTAALALAVACGCGGGSSGESSQGAAQKSKGGMGSKGGGRDKGPDEAAAVPVEVKAVARRSISSFYETNGTLEAENDVQIVSRVAGPVMELATEEGVIVKKGDLLARIDEAEPRAQVRIARVALTEANRAFERAKGAMESEVISEELYDQALAQVESRKAQLENSEIVLGYTTISAPFDGVIVERNVKLADNVTTNQVLFRITDFDPLLCPIQVPEKELSRLKLRQPAQIVVEAWPEERFQSRVLRISPVVDATTGTIKVTLEVGARGKLRPGMFASVFLEMDTHDRALVIPKSALSFETFGDTVYLANEGIAERRDLKLGFEEADFVEVLEGLSEVDRVIVVGQDGLSDGTPVQILAGPGAREGTAAAPRRAADRGAETSPGPLGDRPPGGGMGRMDFSKMTPEQLEQAKERMRGRGMSEEQIKEIVRRRRGESKQP